VVKFCVWCITPPCCLVPWNRTLRSHFCENLKPNLENSINKIRICRRDFIIYSSPQISWK
jgi:hypothetical protein